MAGFVLAAGAPGTPLPYRNPHLSVDARVRDLLRRMTPEEKFWQLFMIPGDLDDPANDYSHGVFGLQISATPRGAAPPTSPAEAARAHAARINTIQQYFVERTRLGIPIIPFDEAVHGLVRDGATMYPQAIGLAATWDPALVGRVAEAIASETILDGIRRKLGPSSDVRYAPGPGRTVRDFVVVPAAQLSSEANGRNEPGLRGGYFDNPRLEGAPRIVRTDPRVDFGWTLNSPARGIPFDWYSVRWTGALTIPSEGVNRVGVQGNDGYRHHHVVVDRSRGRRHRRMVSGRTRRRRGRG
ncbi:MAG: hypothetical protein DMF86_23165, partial [Acidobacteria bacterium]